MTEKLTKEQINNWRKVMPSLFGVTGDIFPDDAIQKFKDNLQENINKEEKDENIRTSQSN